MSCPQDKPFIGDCCSGGFKKSTVITLSCFVSLGVGGDYDDTQILPFLHQMRGLLAGLDWTKDPMRGPLNLIIPQGTFTIYSLSALSLSSLALQQGPTPVSPSTTIDSFETFLAPASNPVSFPPVRSMSLVVQMAQMGFQSPRQYCDVLTDAISQAIINCSPPTPANTVQSVLIAVPELQAIGTHFDSIVGLQRDIYQRDNLAIFIPSCCGTIP